MKTGLQMLQDCFRIINVDDILVDISGKVYLNERPQNSQLQDIVLNTLALSNEQLQQGVINVNVHCPNLSLTIGSKTDNTMPDNASMTLIGNLLVAKLNDYLGYDFRLSVTIPGLIVRDEKDGSFFLNIRLTYYAFQQSYSNI